MIKNKYIGVDIFSGAGGMSIGAEMAGIEIVAIDVMQMIENQQIDTQASNPLYWKFDISTFQLLGRELITDRITALFELVKNCYDANATKVYVEFYNINPLSGDSKIVIRDNGLGMSFTDVRDKWMTIGTGSKRVARLSPPPFNRRVVGKKGVGRFAVDKLGSKLVMKTTQKDSSDVTCLETDWSVYEKLLQESDRNISPEGTPLFTEIANKCWTENEVEKNTSQGTRLEITNIRDTWTEQDIKIAYSELSKLVSPLVKPPKPFDIFLHAPNFGFDNQLVTNNAIQYATIEATLGFDAAKGTQEVLKSENGILKNINIPKPSFGFVKFKLYYFDQAAKKKYKASFVDAQIDGIKIYRDGIITTPFAEYENTNEKKRDILSIDKRRYSGFFDKVSSSDLLGILEITDEANPEIKEATNRQDFVDNPQYRELKQFIIDQLSQLEEYKISLRTKATKTTKTELKVAYDNLVNITNVVRDIKKRVPIELKGSIELLEKQTRKIQIDVKKGVSAYQQLEKEQIEDKNLYLSLMSLQDYAVEIAHVVKTSIGKIKSSAEFFNRQFPNIDFNDQFKKSSKRIFNEMMKLDSVINFLLSYARSNIDFKEINFKDIIENLLLDAYAHIFADEKIEAEIDIKGTFKIVHNQKFFEDIFENLISNSVKALKNQSHKQIKCTGLVEDDKFVIYFSDNGTGIAEEDKHRVFNIYFTKTAEDGGAGIGLYIVKTRIESMKGTVEVIENEFKPHGATFKIVLPFVNTQ